MVNAQEGGSECDMHRRSQLFVIQFLQPAILLGAEHGGPAVGAVTAGPEPPVQARRVEDVPAAQQSEPPVLLAAAPLQTYGAL